MAAFRKIILSGLPSDSHTWNLIFLQLFLEEKGYSVHNLGACVPTRELLGAIVEERPVLVVISSINGHGFDEALSLIQAIKTSRLSAISPVAIGGKLSTRSGDESAIAARLMRAGFAGVFLGTNSIDAFDEYLTRKIVASPARTQAA